MVNGGGSYFQKKMEKNKIKGIEGRGFDDLFIPCQNESISLNNLRASFAITLYSLLELLGKKSGIYTH